MPKQFSSACERNSGPICALLQQILKNSTHVLEIGSGTGQHAVYFGAAMPHLTWHSSDLPQNHSSILAWQQEARLPNVVAPLTLSVSEPNWPVGPFDAVFSANTCHIMAWNEVEAMFAGIGRLLPPGGLLCIYGPFNLEEGQFSSLSNAQFDAILRAQAAHMGIRDFAAVNALAAAQGLELQANYQMPANNQLLVWRRN
jgi:cyclopropane fatty-acyl-phospholipid synthase-like methyltransferase